MSSSFYVAGCICENFTEIVESLHFEEAQTGDCQESVADILVVSHGLVSFQVRILWYADIGSFVNNCLLPQDPNCPQSDLCSYSLRTLEKQCSTLIQDLNQLSLGDSAAVSDNGSLTGSGADSLLQCHEQQTEYNPFLDATKFWLEGVGICIVGKYKYLQPTYMHGTTVYE